MTLPGFKVLNIINEGQHSYIYLAEKVDIAQKVVIKSIKKEFIKSRHAATLKHEFTILKKINSPRVIEPISFETTPSSCYLVEKDFDGVSLLALMKEKKLNLKKILAIAIGLAEGIGDIHNQLIIHKDIKPQNIIVNEITNEVKIIDFGISTLLSREVQEVINPEALEGSIPYISPEQTGRMNRSIDYRTDIYSLGVTLYEMLAGQLPFNSSDLMELIYMHIAKQATPPHEINPDIPEVLSLIVLKCMEKDPESRYHSGHGLKNDLEECLNRLETKGIIDFFTPGQRDVIDRFQIPQKLYGREKEIETLTNQVQTSENNSSLFLISGYSGIGKSSVVFEMQKPIINKKGFFISGKYEQFKKDIPFNAFIQAFQSFVHQILSESNENLNKWKTNLLNGLENNGQLIIDIIPELELVIGPQPPVQKVDFSEAENRFFHVFINFIKVILQPGSPLVIFLDDLQWADFSSFKLLFSLVTEPEVANLVIIGAYRSNEIDPSHPLVEVINKINKEGKKISSLELGSLSFDTVNQLVSDVLHSSLEKAYPLANIVFKKTRGNPFFINRFLTEIYKEGLLFFNAKNQTWESDVNAIENLEVTENVAEYIGKTLLKLPLETQETLKIASAIGNTFDLQTLSIITGIERNRTTTYLWTAIQADCISALQTAYSLDLMNLEEGAKQSSFLFKFQHDRIQQAAYSLIPKDEINKLHLKIARTLLSNLPDKLKEEKFIDIVNHFNLGIDLLKTEEEKLELAKLNDLVGKKALKAIAYPAAEKYFLTGISLLPPNCWQTHYDLTYSLHEQLAIALHLSGRPLEAINAIDDFIDKVKTSEEKAILNLLKMEPNLSYSGFKAAMDCGKEALKNCGVTKFELNKLNLIINALKIKFKLKNLGYEKIKEIPDATDRKAVILADIFSRIATMAVYVNSNEFAYVVIRVINLTFKYGLTPSTGTALMGFALSLTKYPFLEFNNAYKLGSVAFELTNRHLSDKSCFIASLFYISRIARYGERYKDLIPKLQRLSHQGIALGQIWTATGPVYYIHSMICFLMGNNLDETLKEAEGGVTKQYKTRMPASVYASLHIRQLIRVLKGDAEEFEDTSFYDWGPYASLLEKIYSQQRNVPFYIFGDQIFVIVIHYFKERYQKAAESYENLMKEFDGVFPGDFKWGLGYFFGGLSLSALLKQKYDKKYFKQLKYIHKLLKAASDAFPPNFIYLYLIISAEINFLNGKIDLAIEECLEAIKHAKTNENLFAEAIGNELIASYYQAKNNNDKKETHIQRAYDVYNLWGSSLKLTQMEKKYPDICQGLSKTIVQKEKTEDIAPTIAMTVSVSSATTMASKENLAIYTIVQSAQALSEEIVFDKLVDKLMRLVMIEAGAEKAYLIFSTDGKLTLEAEIYQNEENAHLLKGMPIENKKDQLSISIVNYVSRSLKQIVLKDAFKEGRFTQDPYIIANRAQSILCIPLRYQGRLTGLLYMENRLVRGAFTAERSSMLSLLSSQIAISIENARFYGILEDKIQSRTAELSERNIELEKTLEMLKTTQMQLIESEKLAALGQVIAGTAQQVKDPLAKVKSAAETSKDEVNVILHDLRGLLKKIDKNKLDCISQILNLSTDNKDKVIDRDQILSSLKKADIHKPEEIADKLVLLGIQDDITTNLKSLGEDVIPALNYIVHLTNYNNQNNNILNSVEEAANIVQALKNIRGSTLNPMTPFNH